MPNISSNKCKYGQGGCLIVEDFNSSNNLELSTDFAWSILWSGFKICTTLVELWKIWHDAQIFYVLYFSCISMFKLNVFLNADNDNIHAPTTSSNIFGIPSPG